MFRYPTKRLVNNLIQVNLHVTDSMGPVKLVCHMQSPSYTYDTYLICMELGSSVSSVIALRPAYSGPSYASSPVLLKHTTTIEWQFTNNYPKKESLESRIANTLVTDMNTGYK